MEIWGLVKLTIVLLMKYCLNISVELNTTYYGCCNLSFLGRYVRIYGTLLAYGFNGFNCQIIGYP